MKLYVDHQCTSPFAMSAFVALRECQVDFEMHYLDLSQGEHHRPPFTGISLTHRVPTLVDGAFSLAESSAIAEYLNDLSGGTKLFPADLRARAQARQIQAWLRSDFFNLRNARPTETIFIEPIKKPLGSLAMADAQRLVETLSHSLQDGRKFLFGEWCIADVDAAGMLNRLIYSGEPVPDALKHYALRAWDRDSVREWLDIDRRSAKSPSKD
ncbi:glutathione transferase [Pseudomonas sp. NPDC089530]|uniref:glutathione transferase n=1 Tax=Pseudomonas sp. NPDC089530 TaxID=3390651 RepID=UPI003CFC9555